MGGRGLPVHKDIVKAGLRARQENTQYQLNLLKKLLRIRGRVRPGTACSAPQTKGHCMFFVTVAAAAQRCGQ